MGDPAETLENLKVFIGMMKAMYNYVTEGHTNLMPEAHVIYEAYKKGNMGDKLFIAVCEFSSSGRSRRWPDKDIMEMHQFWKKYKQRYCTPLSPGWKWTLKWSKEINDYCLKNNIGEHMTKVLTSLGESSETARSLQSKATPSENGGQYGQYSSSRQIPIAWDNRAYTPNPKRFEHMSLDDCLKKTLDVENKLSNISNKAHNSVTFSNKTGFQELYSEKQDLLLRIAAEFEDRLARNEQDLEDVNRTNRPMKIAEEYQALCAQQWLDAKMELDEASTDGDNECPKHLILLLVFIKTYIKCNEQLETFVNKTSSDKAQAAGAYKTVSGKISAGGVQRNDAGCPATTIGSHTLQALVDEDKTKKEREEIIIKFRAHWNESVPKMLLEEFFSWTEKLLKVADEWAMVFPTIRHQDLPRDESLQLLQKMNKRKSPKLDIFIHKCLELGWKMVTQLPPMSYNCDGIGDKWQGDHLQEIAWGSDAPNGEGHVVIMYATPGLKHGDQPMVKGKVFCGKQGQYQF